MPIWDFSDFADIKDNAKRIVPRINDKVSISVDKKFLYINGIAMPTGPGVTGMILQANGLSQLAWVDPGQLGTGQTGPQGVTGAFGGPPGETGIQGYTGLRGMTGSQGTTGSQGSQGITGLANFYQKTDFNEVVLVPALMWNFKDETFYGYVTGLGGKWIQVSAGAQVGATGLRGYTGTQGVTGLVGVTGAFGGPQGVTGLNGLQGATGIGGGGSVNIYGTTGLQPCPSGIISSIDGLEFPINSGKRYLVEANLLWNSSGQANIGITGPQVDSISLAIRQADVQPLTKYTGYAPVFVPYLNIDPNYPTQIFLNVNASSYSGTFKFLVRSRQGTIITSPLSQVTVKEI